MRNDHTMFPRKTLDLSWGDLAAGLKGCATARSIERATEAVETRWYPEQTLATLSVRTGFDLLLRVLELPRGSHVLVSAVTIPHMIRIIKHHGLVPVPVDLDMNTLEICPEALAKAVTPQARMLLVAHIFGSRMPMAPLVEFARSHDLILVEDCAQAWGGGEWRGCAEADVSMFSMGTIKTATALGGGLLTVRHPSLLRRLRRRMATYPVQSTGEFARKALKTGVLHALTESPWRYGAAVSLLESLGKDHDKVVMAASRGFSGPRFFERIRHRPCAALLSLMLRRVEQADPAVVDRRGEAGSLLASLMPPEVEIPGLGAKHQTWWLFPVLVEDPEAARRALLAEGFDAALGSTSLTWVPAPADMPHTHPTRAHRVMSSILYVPLDAQKMTERTMRRLSNGLQRALSAARSHRHADTGTDAPSPALGSPGGLAHRARVVASALSAPRRAGHR